LKECEGLFEETKHFDVTQKYIKMTKDVKLEGFNKQIKTSSIEEMDKTQSI